jgi:hypothetical protein
MIEFKGTGTQAWNNVEFFFPKSNPYMPFRKIFEKNFAYFPSIFARISMFEHFRGDWAFGQKGHFGLIRWVPKWFFKI